jgi:hypothetical protein
MGFDPNQHLKLAAEETSEGRYRMSTQGLVAFRRAELEVIAVPEQALTAAGSVLNTLAEYAVNRAEIRAEQTVANVLAVRGEDRSLLLVARAVASTKASGGLWSLLTGKGKGVLRLVDPAEDSQTPLMAFATMLVHRATIRRAKGDADGARAELTAAIEAFPGAAGESAKDRTPPAFVGDGAAEGALVNWQNYLAYLDLAALTEDAAEADTLRAAARARCDRAELG